MKHAFRAVSLLAVLATIAVLTGQAVLSGQDTAQPNQPLPTFRAEVEYVEVDVVVTDAQGALVKNLTKDDFQVFEDGKLQTVTNFTTVNLPIERAQRPLFAERPIEPDVQSNERPFDGRTYVMVLDDLHVPALRSQRVKLAARQFIERQMAANDLMAIVFTGGRSQDAQDFTSNKRLLLRSVDRFMGQKLDSATANRNNEFFRQQAAPVEMRDSRINDPDEMQRGQNARNTLRTLQRVSEWFGSVRGRRKSLLYFSEGVDYDLSDLIRAPTQPTSQVSMIVEAIRETITETARANVSIYSIDPRGLTDGGDDAIAIGDFANNTDPRAGIGLNSLRNEIFQAQQTLRSLSEETGGFALVNRNNVAASFDRIVEENSSYYLLAYYPTGDKRPGRFHKIEVKVNKPGMTVRSRRGYMTARPRETRRAGNMPPALFDAVNSPMQVSGVTLRSFVAPFKGTEPNASVLVGLEMFGRDLTLENNAKVEITIMAIDINGKTFGGATDILTLNFRPETKTRVQQTGIRALHRLELPPGRYQVRAAVRDATKNVAGSVIQDLEVPSFYKESLSMSGLTLTSLGTPAMMIPKQDEQLRGVLPAPPVAQRVFQSNDEIALFAEVYDRTSNNPHKLEITTSVLTDEGRSLFKTDDVRDSSELQGAKGGYGVTARIPLTDIPPGRYVLSVEARSRVGNNPSVTRQIQFEVRAPAPRPAAN